MSKQNMPEGLDPMETFPKVIPSVVFTVDKDLNITGWSDKAAIMTGYKAAEMIGRKCDALGPGFCGDIPGTCKMGAGSGDKDSLSCEGTLRRKDGSTIKIVKSIFVMRNDAGDLLGAVEFFYDSTSQRNAEDKMRKMSRAVEQSPSVIVITDTKGNIEYVNPKFTQLTGYTIAEIRGRNSRVLKSGGQPDEVYSGMWAAISKGDEWRGEFLNKKKDGELYWENAALSPIRNAVGEITNYLKVSEDITQRKTAEEALRKATEELGEKTKRLQELDKLKSKFISTVSHELRTPLSITKEGISLVMDGIAGPVNEKQKNILGTASRNIDRLARIINNLLDISKIEAGKVGLKREMCDAVAVAEQVAAAFKYNVEEKGLEMRRKYGAGKIDVYADSDRLAEIFTNLLGNSVKFAERGYIEIGVLDKGPGLECYVYDTGIGVKGEDLVRIFDRFYQPERELVGGEQGTGLGLAIAKELVELHGGRIYAESEYGKWTKVTFIIPRNGGTHG